jgi:hypothetical protein
LHTAIGYRKVSRRGQASYRPNGGCIKQPENQRANSTRIARRSLAVIPKGAVLDAVCAKRCVFCTRSAQRQAVSPELSCSFQKRTTLRFVVSKSGQALLDACLRGTGGRCPPRPPEIYRFGA